jgi:hypothetical protein
MRLPDYPAPGQALTVSWGRQLVDYIRSITPVSSPGFLISSMPAGTTFALTNKIKSPDAVDASPLEYHFRPVKKTATSIEVHAGRTYIGSTTLKMSVTSGGGTSGSYSDIYTISSVAAAGWLCLDLDDSKAPTTLIPSMHASFPDAAGDKSWPVAYVPFADGAIGTIEPYWTGGDFVWPVRQIRFVAASGKLQYTYLLNPGSGDWIDITTAEDC